MTLDLLKDEYSVFKFNPYFPVKENIFCGKFVSVTKTSDEISVVAVSSASNNYEEVETGWRILKITGVLDFGLIGILSGVIGCRVSFSYSSSFIIIYLSECLTGTVRIVNTDFEIFLHEYGDG
jgi:hypothetical protein